MPEESRTRRSVSNLSNGSSGLGTMEASLMTKPRSERPFLRKSGVTPSGIGASRRVTPLPEMIARTASISRVTLGIFGALSSGQEG